MPSDIFHKQKHKVRFLFMQEESDLRWEDSKIEGSETL